MNWQVIKNRIRKVFAYTITSILFLLISAFLFLQMPPVQNWLISLYLKDFSTIVGFPSTIESFKMLWFDRLELNGVTVYDPEGNKMIRAEEILINFKVSHILHNGNVNIDGIFLDSAHVFLTNIQENDSSRDLNFNVFINQINENFSGGGGGGKSPKVNIGEAVIHRSQFTLVNQDQDSIKQGFNYNQFSLAIDEGQLRSFEVIGDTTQFDLRTLIAQDLETKFTVKQISTFFRVSQGGMEFLGLNMNAGKSVVNDTVIFRYESMLDLNHFFDRVSIYAHLTNTIIDHNDLAVFAPGVEQLGKPLYVNGVVRGRVNKFKINDMDIRMGDTHVRGTLDMDGLPNINETFIILNLNETTLNPRDIAFVLDDDILERLAPMGTMSLNGQFLGYPYDFVANGTLLGKLGLIKSDINFKVNEADFNRSDYSGKLTLTNFKLGRYLNDTATFKQVTLDGRIAGSGLTLTTADFKLNGKISSIGILDYTYSNISTNARFAKGLFSGFVAINDPNLEFTANGSIDLRQGKNHIKIDAKLDTAFVHNLKLSNDNLFLKSSFTADVQGLSLDSIIGHANFNDIFVQYKTQSLALRNINIVADRNATNRSVNINSSLLDAKIDGSYSFSNLTNDLGVLAHELMLSIRNNRNEIRDYYSSKTYRHASYEAAVDVILKDVRPIVDLLNLQLKITPNTRFEGRFTSGYTTIFNAFSEIDSLEYDGTLFLNTEVELTASKIADSTAVLAVATVSSQRQSFNKRFNTKNLLAEGIWSRNHIDFGIDFDEVGSTNYVRLKGGVDFKLDSTVVVMDPSHVMLLEKDWNFGPDNYLSIKGSDLNFHQFSLVTGKQRIALDGIISKDPRRRVKLKIDELDLTIFNVLTDVKIEGTANAETVVSNLYGKVNVQNAISIHNFTIDNFLIGDIAGNNRWDTARSKFDINLAVDRQQNRIVSVTGDYQPNHARSPLNINAKLQQANLKIAEPFLIDIFSHIGGTVSGDFKITGKLESPELNGEGVVSDGQLMINYLRTMYRFGGKIGLTPSSIYFKEIALVDAFRNNAQLEGVINHQNFNSMVISLNADFKTFQVLNTTFKDNNLFYGQAYASGNVRFDGPLSNLRITSNARTEKNTRIYIPISGTSAVEKQEFIDFVSLKDTTITKVNVREVGTNKINLTGLTFNFNIDVTPEAYCEIIFDQKAGDIIRGRGVGDLKLELDTKGEFNMFGPFEFTQGWYNFTLYDIINKEFEIQKGSRITWYGDPYQGILDINASYNQLASLAPLLQDQTITTSPQIRRKYPVQVILKLQQYMLSPEIAFDIAAKDLPKNIQTAESQRTVNLDLEFTAFKNKLDEQELYRQVFSLIVLRRFSPPESFNTSGSVVNSVSELLSNQLSYWMSQVDENLEIDVDLNIMDQEAFNTFQLRLSYTFFNGRLRVTGDGTYNNANNNVTAGAQPSPSSVAGDWTVDYKLTADGKLRVKMYSRTNVNPILSSVNNQNQITTGASVIHTQSFNELRDLWITTRRRNKKENSADSIQNNTDALPEENEIN